MRAPTAAASGRPGVAATYLLFLGLPLAMSPAITDSFSPLRLLVLGAGLGIGLLAAPTGRLPRSIWVAIGLGVAAFTAAASVGATPLLSLLGRYPRYEGLPVVLGYGLAALVGARLLGPGSSLRRHARHALAGAGVLNVVVAVGQAVADPSARVTGLLGNSTLLGTFCLLVLAVLGTAWTRREGWWTAGLVAAATGLVLSASRGALLGGGLAALALLAVRLASGRRQRWWLGPVLATAIGLAAWLWPASRARLSGSTPFAESTITGRWLLWQDTAALAAENPWLGVGPSRFVDSIGAHHTAAWAAEVGPYAPPDSPHNVVLQLLAATGWIGLLAAGGIVATWGVALWRRRPWDSWQVGAVLAAVGLGVTYLTSFTDPVTTTLGLAVAGGAVAADRATPAPRTAAAARAGAVGALVLGVWLGSTALVAEGRFSAAITVRPDTTGALLAVPEPRAWDADLARRVGYTAARLTEQGLARPAAFVETLASTCDRLPGSVECLQVLADLQDLSGDHAAALATLDRAIAADPNNVDTILRQGISQAGAGRVALAEERFKAAAALRPSAAEPWTNLARLYDLQGRTADAARARARADELGRR